MIVSTDNGSSFHFSAGNQMTTQNLKLVATGGPEGKILIGGRNATILASSDAESWSDVSYPDGNQRYVYTGIYTGGNYIIGGNRYLESTAQFFRSPTPSNFVMTNQPAPAGNIFGICQSSSHIIAIGDAEMIVRAECAGAPLTLLAPNGGELVAGGDSYDIRWQAQAGMGTLTLEYSTTSATGPWTEIATGVDAATGSYAWTVPALDTQTAYVRVSETGGSYEDASSAPFSIIPQPLAGVTWQQKWTGTSKFWSVTSDGTRWVAVGDSNVSGKAARLMHSLDGKTWTAEDISALGLTGELFEVCNGNGLFVAVGTGGGIITRPTDYSAGWTKQNSGTSAGLGGVCYGNGLYVAVGSGGVILTSPDALAWTARTSNVSGYLDSVIWAGGQFVASGQNRNVCTSPDGITWTAQTAGLGSGSEWLVTLTHNGSLYALGGTGGLIFTSPDAVTWTARTSGTTGGIGALAWTGERFIGVGDNGMAFRSDDGTTWTLFASCTSADLCGLAVSGDEAVAVGEGVTLYSQGSSVTPATADLNGDGHTDLVWRYNVTGENMVWLLEGGVRVGGGPIPIRADLTWQIAAVGDLDNDGKADVVWRNTTTGDNQVWLMDGVTRRAGAALEALVDTNWQIVGCADFNGDGKNDLLWRHPITGNNMYWPMNGILRDGDSVLLPRFANETWLLVGVDDFDQDGKPDILWRSPSTGLNMIMTVVDNQFTGRYWVRSMLSTDWVVVGTGDLNGDKKPDVIWRNIVTGHNMAWIMDGLSKGVGLVWIRTLSALSWERVN